MVGSIAIGVVFAASLIACILYAFVARGRTELLTSARITTHVAIWATLIAAGTLLYFIFNYRFDINYVYEHVSRSLSKPLLFAAFYASQEGSFMLWMVLTAIVAIFLMPYAARHRYEGHVMAVFLTVLIFISIMLLIRSPFETIYSAHPGEVEAGFFPKDGKGLNPSLENLWIVIHPPMLFTGFALLAVPFAFAVAALLRRDYQGWVNTSLPWTLGACMILGFGIILGGFWAYETLGWGGYWAWDPVENASLLPWIIGVASFHTMLTQRKTGGLVKTNIAMILLAYFLVIYCSFLTRSGVLGDASVHSFADPGSEVFTVLVIALVALGVGSLVLFASRIRDMNVSNREYSILSRETALAIGSSVLGASALVVFLGTSAPLLSIKTPVDFYAKLHVPIAIVLMLVNGLSLALKWKQSNKRDMVRKSLGAFILAVVLGVVLYLAGIQDISYSAIIVASLFALFVNIEVAYRLTAGKIGFVVDKHADMRSRIFGALKWAVVIGILAVVIGTNGDYYQFGNAILSGGLIWAGFAILLIVLGVVGGRFGFKLDKRFIGPYVAHAGLALFILGVVASSHYEDKRDFELIEGEQVKAFDGQYTFMYGGYEFTHPQNYHFNINVTDGNGEVTTARPVLFASAFDNFKNYTPNPGILKFTARDLYFTVKGVERAGGPPTDSLFKGGTIPAFGGKMDITFLDFDFSQEERAKMMSEKPFRVKAILLAKDRASGKADTIVTSVTRDLRNNDVQKEDVKIGTTGYHVQLSELRPNLEDRSKSQIFIETFDEATPPPPMKDKVFVEAYIKPYINLVWLGVLVLTIGFGLSTIRRRREAIANIERAERAFEHFKAAQAEGHGPVHHERSHHLHPAKKKA